MSNTTITTQPPPTSNAATTANAERHRGFLNGRVDKGNSKSDSGQQDYFAVGKILISISVSFRLFGQIQDFIDTLTADQLEGICFVYIIVSKIMAISTYFLLLFIIPYATSLTFNFTNIRPNNRDIQVTGDAYISDEGIQVTPDGIATNRRSRGGRATYIRELHLWDSTSGELASFTTDFTFVIDSMSESYYADGLTFFLAKNNSLIPLGAAMGLPVTGRAIDTRNPFVAVEFDTFWNRFWDPRNSSGGAIGEHVGISVNSLESVAHQKWFSNISDGRLCQAWITYDSTTKNLSVSFTGFQNSTTVLQYLIDLRNVLPEWVIFGFSAATGDLFQKNNVKSWAFNSSDLQIENNNELPPTSSPDQDLAKRNSYTGVILGSIVGLFVSVIFVAILAFFVRRRKKKSREDEAQGVELDVEMNNEFEMGTGARSFSYLELARATRDFAEEEKLGEGGFGGVYKGFLKDLNTYVAVKRISKTSKQGLKEYSTEVRVISRLRHRNLVQLIGWCHEKGELLLVYEFMENGSLDSHLFKAKSLVTWGTRYKIACGVASALLYLHEGWEQCVLHRDIKSSNVMLDSNFNAKVGDFGMAKLVDHDKGPQTTMLAGTLGYLAPECVATGKASKESDVFSFGVVALEIACGRKAINYEAEEKQVRLVEWVWELYGTRTLLEAVDSRMGPDFLEDEMKRLMVVGLWCANPDSKLRPSMRQAIQVLNYEASLPTLPSKMPMPLYLAPPMSSLFGVPSMVQNQSSSSVPNTDSSKQTTSSTSSCSPSVALLHSTK
ncbi:hypothetical protein OSB04_016241 [Centaurea solstitialis]|uniref:non-specific serine/threonine protein kinase n=1 Tax=Centaurea solstitialis TaxID=347529 RepID=A0AA38TDT9_9ASTR|nr:hypothetical protein OSB04_016241 [Centaurea solstitialis]